MTSRVSPVSRDAHASVPVSAVSSATRRRSASARTSRRSEDTFASSCASPAVA